jgi:peroxiredoxin
MAQFEPHKSEMEEAGAQLVFMAAEKRDGMWKPAKFLARHPVSFPFLLDEDRAVTKAYGLYNRLGRDAINIARTATLVIDRQGTIRYLYRGENQNDRAPMEQVMEAVRRIV